MSPTPKDRPLPSIAPPQSIGYGWITPLASIAAERGVDVSHVLYCLGIDASCFRHTYSRLTPRQTREFWRLSIAHIGDKLIGINAGELLDLKLFPGIGTAVAHARDLEHAIELMRELAACIATDLAIDSEVQNGRWIVRFRTTEQPTALCYERVAMTTFLIKLARTQPIHAIVPREVHFKGGLQCDTEVVSQRLGMPVVTDKEEDILIFDLADKNVPFKHAGEELCIFGAGVARYFLSRLSLPATFSEQVRQQINIVLERTDPKLSVVAQELGISVRTLQRRLDQEKASYAELLEDVKRHFLTELLVYSNAPIARISQVLHFSEPSSLTRACVRWFGLSPMNYRKKARAQLGLTQK